MRSRSARDEPAVGNCQLQDRQRDQQRTEGGGPQVGNHYQKEECQQRAMGEGQQATVGGSVGLERAQQVVGLSCRQQFQNPGAEE